MKLYRIKDWDDLYENSRTKVIESTRWIPVPNSQDGEGYTLLISQKNGPSLFGAWIAILQVASKCNHRGILMRDTGKAHDSKSLARLTRFPESIIQEALEFLSCDDMQWMQVSDIVDSALEGDGNSLNGNGNAIDCNSKAPVLNGMEGNGIVDTIPQPSAEDLRFDQFWKSYPKKVGKIEARKKFHEAKVTDSMLIEMLKSLDWQKKSNAWINDNGKYIPDPERWLKKGKWMDEKKEESSEILQKGYSEFQVSNRGYNTDGTCYVEVNGKRMAPKLRHEVEIGEKYCHTSENGTQVWTTKNPGGI